MDEFMLREILVDDLDVQIAYLDDTVNQIMNYEDFIKKDFFEYLKEQKISDISVGKYNLKDLINIYKLKPIGAFMLLDWLYKDPVSAKRAFEFGI